MAKELEDLIELYEARLNASDRSLSRNWTTQIILVFISLYSFVGGDEPIAEFTEKLVGFKANTIVLRGIIATLLLYYFMRFGFLLGTFGNMRLACNELFERILKEADKSEIPVKEANKSERPVVERLFDTANFFEPLFQPGKRFVVLLVLITSSVVAVLNHTCIFIHIYMMAGKWVTVAVGLAVLSVLFPFYVEFYNSNVANKLHASIKLTAWIVPLLATLSLFLLFFLAPPFSSVAQAVTQSPCSQPPADGYTPAAP